MVFRWFSSVLFTFPRVLGCFFFVFVRFSSGFRWFSPDSFQRPGSDASAPRAPSPRSSRRARRRKGGRGSEGFGFLGFSRVFMAFLFFSPLGFLGFSWVSIGFSWRFCFFPPWVS